MPEKQSVFSRNASQKQKMRSFFNEPWMENVLNKMYK
jgi:hypothetical protein